ncbi:MAG: hypothetical protein HY775_01410 [Acidobacteria bacterium]|nr:hypothetical protein [Acidobacteriota bacterium]
MDERFTRYLSNNASGFAPYSGVDAHNTYAFDREGWRYTHNTAEEPCRAIPVPGSTIVNGYATTLDPVKGLDDDDEMAFMYRDADAQAPPTAALPEGIDSSYEILVADPTNPAQAAFVYVMLAGSGGPVPAFDASNGYVHYARDAGADTFVYSQSDYKDYGAAPKGPYCYPDGSADTSHGVVAQRRPLDTAWVRTPRYSFRYEGRWLMTELHVNAATEGNTGADPANWTYGPDLVDQWKARAFQQRPGGSMPCCGYEEEVNNWGGSSILMGERSGPVRVIRATWGADSSTNNVRTEIFYRDEVLWGDALRVHVMPPLDGIYVQWDYNAGKVSTYYNPFVPGGVPIDGQNDEVFGNTSMHVSKDRVEVRDDDPIPVVGPQAVTVPLGGDPGACEIASAFGESLDCVSNDVDVVDPTFSGPAGLLNWEEIAGGNGTLVTRWTIERHTAGDAYQVIATPYYRDDSCFDDGTGSDPGPHLNGRNADDGEYAKYTDYTGTHDRECWTPAAGDPAGSRRFWQGDIATHGMHINFIADSDNAFVAAPVTEINTQQRIVVLPGDPGNVGERYGRGVEYPLTSGARFFEGSAAPVAHP